MPKFEYTPAGMQGGWLNQKEIDSVRGYLAKLSLRPQMDVCSDGSIYVRTGSEVTGLADSATMKIVCRRGLNYVRWNGASSRNFADGENCLWIQSSLSKYWSYHHSFEPLAARITDKDNLEVVLKSGQLSADEETYYPSSHRGCDKQLFFEQIYPPRVCSCTVADDEESPVCRSWDSFFASVTADLVLDREEEFLNDFQEITLANGKLCKCSQ